MIFVPKMILAITAAFGCLTGVGLSRFKKLGKKLATYDSSSLKLVSVVSKNNISSSIECYQDGAPWKEADSLSKEMGTPTYHIVYPAPTPQVVSSELTPQKDPALIVKDLLKSPYIAAMPKAEIKDLTKRCSKKDITPQEGLKGYDFYACSTDKDQVEKWWNDYKFSQLGLMRREAQSSKKN